MTKIGGVSSSRCFPAMFDDTRHLIGDLYMVRKDAKCGVYDLAAQRVIVPVSFEDLYRLTDYSYLVLVNGQWRAFCILTETFRKVFPLAA